MNEIETRYSADVNVSATTRPFIDLKIIDCQRADCAHFEKCYAVKRSMKKEITFFPHLILSAKDWEGKRIVTSKLAGLYAVSCRDIKI